MNARRIIYFWEYVNVSRPPNISIQYAFWRLLHDRSHYISNDWCSSLCISLLSPFRVFAILLLYMLWTSVVRIRTTNLENISHCTLCAFYTKPNSIQLLHDEQSCDEQVDIFAVVPYSFFHELQLFKEWHFPLLLFAVAIFSIDRNFSSIILFLFIFCASIALSVLFLYLLTFCPTRYFIFFLPEKFVLIEFA